VTTAELAQDVQKVYVQSWNEQGLDIEVTKDLILVHKSGNEYVGQMTVSIADYQMIFEFTVTYDGRAWSAQIKS
jgi:hypothetical protein